MKKLTKLSLSIIVTIIAILIIGTANAVQAVSAGPLYLGIVTLRTSGYGYKQAGKIVWKIAEYDSLTDTTADLSKTIYCIKAGPGFGSTDMSTGGAQTTSTYTQKFNLKDSNSITSPYNSVLPTGENYNKLIWLLDHLYIMPQPGTDNTTNREAFLANIIPNAQYYLLTDDDIDVVQQLAIWYFTNPTGDYHYNSIELYTNTTKNDANSAYKTFEDLYGADGWDRQDAATALYNYYIQNAQADYISSNPTTKPVELIKSNAIMQTIGSNYVAGPYKINQLLNIDYTLTATYTDTNTNETPITPTLGIKDASGNIVSTNKTLKELVGTEFYLIMPTSSNISGIKMTISSSYASRTATYWSVENAPSTEQPVAIVEETPFNFSENASIVVPKPFDLSLRKFITEVNGVAVDSRAPQVDVTALKAGTSTTATYTHSKTPIKVSIGDVVTYTIRVYNEGEVDGYVSEITDHLPPNLELITDDAINIQYGWRFASSSDLKTVKTTYLSEENEITAGENKILAFNGTNLDYREVQIKCKVIATETMPSKITNIADITKFTDGDGNTVTDRDSQADNVELPTGTELENYKDAEINRGEDYIPGQQDDDDFEKLVLKEFDLSLRKFITSVNGTEITSRIPQVDVTPLKNGTGTTAIYNHSKEPVKVTIGSTVVYTIRVYNEGNIDGYAEEITDHIPEQLEYLPENSTNTAYGWTMVDENGNETTDVSQAIAVKTDYLSKANENASRTNKIPAFNGETLSYKEVKIAFKVVETEPMPSKITNIADITDFTDSQGNTVTDRDSQEANVKIPEDLPGYKDSEIGKDYVPGQQDDDDFEKIEIAEFDLSLRKFITAVNNTEITTRIPKVDVTPLKDGSGTTAIYTHPKDPVLVTNSNIVTYTIRVYNEGEANGYVQEVKDDIPEGLEFLPDNQTNKTYRWIMLDKDGNETTDTEKAVSIVTDYLSKEQEKTEGENLLKAFNPATMETLSYKDVKVAFKVIEPATSDRIIINQAQISKDLGENGNEVYDRDSTPDEWNEGEDDQDIEKIKVQYFDLSLRKWVTQAIVIENGEETITETGHKAEDDPEAIAKVDLKKSKIDKVTVKFRYKIRVTNEGTIAGYVKEIKDYIPEGLKFVAEDNPLWVAVDEKTITTDQAKDILLQPGDTTEVEVLLTWINDENNMGVMDNWAEISKDYNEFESPDIDSTPDNNKKGEDDIDDAPVMVTIQTGQIKTYTTITLAVLIIITSGVALIKKFVL